MNSQIVQSTNKNLKLDLASFPPPQDFRYLFLDMNAFFASVEQQENPTLRARPVGVAPYTGRSGCIIASSYKAKWLGVKTGCRVGEARQKIPSIAIVESRPELYRIYHQKINQVLKNHNPFVEPLSIDEFGLTLTGSDRQHPASHQLAQRIKQMIKAQVGDWMTCSIGIGPNLFLAKQAAEYKKPDGLTTLTLARLPIFFRVLKDLTDITGIAERMKHQLGRRDITTPLELFEASESYLRRYLGVNGTAWYYRLHGYDIDHRCLETPAMKTMGHQHVLAPEFRTWQKAFGVLVKMAERLGLRLRRAKALASGLRLIIRFQAKAVWDSEIKTNPFNDTISLLNYTRRLYRHSYLDSLTRPDLSQMNFKPMMVSITATKLIKPLGVQQRLFPNLQRQQQLSRTIDLINAIHGPGAVRSASHWGVDQAAPIRITFGKAGVPSEQLTSE